MGSAAVTFSCPLAGMVCLPLIDGGKVHTVSSACLLGQALTTTRTSAVSVFLPLRDRSHCNGPSFATGSE